MILCFGSENDMEYTRHPKVCGSVKLYEDWMWMDDPFVFYKWDICCWNKQWTVNDIPNFKV